jgi:hypothetical protein
MPQRSILKLDLSRDPTHGMNPSRGARYRLPVDTGGSRWMAFEYEENPRR